METTFNSRIRVKEIALACGASAAGIAAAGELEEFKRFSLAVSAYPQGLSYLRRSGLKRHSLKNWNVDAASALVCAFRYWEPAMDHAAALKAAGDPAAFLAGSGRRITQPELLSLPGAKISRYALSRDYHLAVKEKLSAMLTGIKQELPGVEGVIFCDTSPVLEKELARLAGIGFRGRNTLVMSGELGSYFFIGGIALDIGLEPDKPAAGSCGECRLCEAACPTGALNGGALDAGRCLSYWTTQSKEKIPAELAAKTGGFAYGCDLCQEACPHNKPPGWLAPGFETIKPIK
ncbi:MAG: DUF1730 domain-containing protein [Elusimicrobiota bacterium]|nr:DUF1730 domain-containing protein [Elusimicrobiota bacterium]